MQAQRPEVLQGREGPPPNTGEGVVKFPNTEVFTSFVFSCHVVSSVVETYRHFSENNYVQNRCRSRMRMEVLSSTLHLQEAKRIEDVETVQDDSSIVRHIEDNQQQSVLPSPTLITTVTWIDIHPTIHVLGFSSVRLDVMRHRHP